MPISTGTAEPGQRNRVEESADYDFAVDVKLLQTVNHGTDFADAVIVSALT